MALCEALALLTSASLLCRASLEEDAMRRVRWYRLRQTRLVSLSTWDRIGYESTARSSTRRHRPHNMILHTRAAWPTRAARSSPSQMLMLHPWPHPPYAPPSSADLPHPLLCSSLLRLAPRLTFDVCGIYCNLTLAQCRDRLSRCIGPRFV